MAATPKDRAGYALDSNDRPPVPGRKPWQTPRFIVSEVVADTQYSSDPPTADGPYSQLS